MGPNLGEAVKDLIALKVLQSFVGGVTDIAEIDIDDIKEAAIDEVADFACMAKDAGAEITKRKKGGPSDKNPAGSGDKEEGEGGKNLPPPLQALAKVLDIDKEKIKDAVKEALGVTDTGAT